MMCAFNQPQYLLGLDVGTQSARAALFNIAGELIGIVSESFDLDIPAPGWAQQDPRQWWGALTRIIRKLIEQTQIDPARILCVGVDSQMHAAIPITSDGQVIGQKVQLWCDKRCAEIIDQLQMKLNEDWVYDLAANRPLASWWGFKIKWIQRVQPEIYARAWKFLTGGAYLTYCLTGEIAINISEASGSFLMDAHKKTWSAELIDLCGLDPDKLPRIAPATELIGQVTEQAARSTGLLAGTPVTVGGSDMMASLIAAGMTGPGRAVEISGTSNIMCVFAEQPAMDLRLMNLHHDMPGWVPFGIIDSGGGALRWFRDRFCQAEMELAQASGQDAYDILAEQAAQVGSGSEGVLFFPYLQGERTLGSPYSRGAFIGMTPRSDKAMLFRAILEGISYEMRRTLEIIESSGVKIEQIRTVGGGSRNPLWNQIRADIYGKPIVQLGHSAALGGVMGMAILGGVALGVWPDVSAAADIIVSLQAVYEPYPQNWDRYNALFDVFKETHDCLMIPFERLHGVLGKESTETSFGGK